MIVVVVVVVRVAGDRAALVTLAAVAFGKAIGVLVAPRTRQIGFEIVGSDQILDVQERCALHADIDERGLHARQHTADSTENDVPDRATSRSALDLKFGDDPFFDQGQRGFHECHN